MVKFRKRRTGKMATLVILCYRRKEKRNVVLFCYADNFATKPDINERWPIILIEQTYHEVTI